MNQIVAWWLGWWCLWISSCIFANSTLLSAEEAFVVKVESISESTAQISWQIQDGYYLYQHQMSVQQGTQNVALTLPPAESIYDDNYGQTQVYFQHIAFDLPTQAAQNYRLSWQGCAKDKICYPIQSLEFKTDINGLVVLNSAPNRVSFNDLASQNLATPVTSEPANVVVAQDQHWSQQLANASLIYGAVLFFGLGILLAFTPCSLPMLPILTALLVRDHKGLKAWMIALAFVVSMASVYALLGLIASVAGLNFQRWLQQPFTLICFSGLFVLFALNLFGVFELKLPQSLVQRLDRAQAMQQGGTLLSASIMGILSALLVGPCMTAPLAGALLFIAQTQQQLQGAMLLFVLGFGMGTPLLLASILGTKVLPQLGVWMNQVKTLFAFLMLAVALYFIRSLLSEAWMQGLSLLLAVSFIVYAITKLNSKLASVYVVILCAVVPYVVYSQYQQSKHWFSEKTASANQWHIAKTAEEFQQLLAQAPAGKKIVVDVYADWCIACQPIEKGILTSAAVQEALADFYLIKLDLSQYDQQHQALLNQWQILGPPTYLFLDSTQQEQRHLRLTGAFTKEQLLAQLKQFEP